ncbi:1-phosphofructokinase family hexose kinase [Microbacterium esteraromaticum]|uniref:1-phosphofructokinase family hexose kinase n=1 Tax=Microbacterium esteraromaticum TaxID=57043 RepID=A0A7D7WI13_9MICO|nr:PfkB family carbohydrate kinase [Microbacterium esteraromaticum]QMU96850.1 1-phosphofructokinase family hexose kinase [Microbacterium esteraromaticum]
MIVTVTPNPALDLTWHVASLVVGGTHRVDAGQVRAGGKGLNVARVAHAQGADVRAVTTSGGATGEELAAELASSGVPNVLVPVAAATRRSVALVDEALGDTTIMNERGVAPSATEWDALREAVAEALGAAAGGDLSMGASAVGRTPASGPTADASAPDPHPVADPSAPDPRPAERARVLVISGSLPPGTPDDALPSLIRLGLEAGATVIADTSGPALLAAAEAGASVLKPNEHELRDATGLDDPIDGARELVRRGARLVLLSLGADGMLAVSPAASGGLSVLHARLDRSLAGNPTGAGDAGVAACAVLMDAGIHEPAQILRRATAWSAAAVLMPLAGEIHPTWPDLEAALTLTSGAPSGEKPHPARETRARVAPHAESGLSPGERPASHPKEPR